MFGNFGGFNSNTERNLITRLDLDLNVVRWSRTYYADSDAKQVEALALSPSD